MQKAILEFLKKNHTPSSDEDFAAALAAFLHSKASNTLDALLTYAKSDGLDAEGIVDENFDEFCELLETGSATLKVADSEYFVTISIEESK